MKKTISRNNRIQDKKVFKQMAGQCRICGESNYSLLDIHRAVIPGKDDGKYTVQNSVVLCCLHHRMEQAGQIKILGWVDSTAGQLLHYIDENGIEQFT
jgi:predicted restriction endonuclease